jgi:hypothetical protein
VGQEYYCGSGVLSWVRSTVYEEVHDCAPDRMQAEQGKSNGVTTVHGAEDASNRTLLLDDILGCH